jgi:aspartate aminotransferase
MRQRAVLAHSLERALRVGGYCAPTTLMQLLASRLAGLVPATDELARMQRLTREQLVAAGYQVVRAEATTFIYVRVPHGDEAAFVARAADQGVLVMPSSIFHEPGYFRIALNVGPPELGEAVARLAHICAGA